MWIPGRFSDYKLSPYGWVLLILVGKLFAGAVEGYRHIYVILEVFIPPLIFPQKKYVRRV